jgi:hypothetical protein
MFCHCLFVWMSKQYVPVDIFYSSPYRSTSLSDVPLIMLRRYAPNPRSLQSLVVLRWTKDTGDLPRRQSNLSDVFGQHSAEPVVSCLEMWTKSDRGGVVLRHGGWRF